jgi:hypothetical protein
MLLTGTALQAAVTAGDERCVNVISNAMLSTCDVNELKIKNELSLAISLNRNTDIESEGERQSRRNIVYILIEMEDQILEKRSILNMSDHCHTRKKRRID